MFIIKVCFLIKVNIITYFFFDLLEVFYNFFHVYMKQLIFLFFLKSLRSPFFQQVILVLVLFFTHLYTSLLLVNHRSFFYECELKLRTLCNKRFVVSILYLNLKKTYPGRRRNKILLIINILLKPKSLSF